MEFYNLKLLPHEVSRAMKNSSCSSKHRSPVILKGEHQKIHKSIRKEWRQKTNIYYLGSFDAQCGHVVH